MTRLGKNISIWLLNDNANNLFRLCKIAASLGLASASFITFGCLAEGYFKVMPYPAFWYVAYFGVYLVIFYQGGWVWLCNRSIKRFTVVCIYLALLPALFGYYLGSARLGLFTRTRAFEATQQRVIKQ